MESVDHRSKLNIATIIPARLGSSRFPNKPLAPLLGTPMVELVRRNAASVEVTDVVVVATCDQEIIDLVEDSGGRAEMTSDKHERASDRTAEAVKSLEAQTGQEFDLVLMLQGDEPTVTPRQMAQVIDAMQANPSIGVANLLGSISSEREFRDPNCIKVVTDMDSNALYFSRLPIPGYGHFSHPSVGKQVCAIGFRRDVLLDYVTKAPTPLEELESIDMLRVLEHGGNVKMIPTTQPNQSVDVPEDIPLAEAHLKDQGIG